MSELPSPLDPHARAPAGYPLVATKLNIPPVRPGLVSRPRLLAQLDQGLHCRLILLSGPAGGGKTTLLSEWLAQATCPAAWLSLEPGDGDAARFLGYLIAALRTVLPRVGEASERLMQAPESPSWQMLLPPLINEIATAAGGPFILVLDDYHTIGSPAIHNGLVFLLEHLPPQMHLVIATRIDPPLPLSRFRSRGQMLEVRSSDLRFTADEAAAFLKQAMGLELSPAQVATLEARTEGWIAGLQMAALSLQRRAPESIDRLVAGFSGRQHYILDYLTDEVLAHQPGPVQDFLLRTCILDRMCGPLCDAVMACEPQTAKAPGRSMLEYLDHANLFVVPLDDTCTWYRYHPLFVELLRSRLAETQTGLAADLHRRASAWFERNGTIEEAVGHALAAGDSERVACLAEQGAPDLVARGRVDTLLGWIDALPQPLVHGRAWLCIRWAAALCYLGKAEQVEAPLQAAEAHIGPGLPSAEARQLAAEVAYIRARVAVARGDLARGVEFAEKALNDLPAGQAALRSRLSFLLARVHLIDGSLNEASLRMGDVARLRRDAGDIAGAVSSLCHVANMAYICGRLRHAAETFREAEALATKVQWQFTGAGIVHVGLAAIELEWNNLEAARQHLGKGIELVERWPNPNDRAFAYVYLSRVLLAQRDLPGASEALARAEYLEATRTLYPEARGAVQAWRANLWLAQGNLAAAVRWAEERRLDRSAVPAFRNELEQIARARILVSQATGPGSDRSLDEPLDLLARLAQAAQAGGRLGRLIEMRILQARAHQARGDGGAALAPMQDALAMAAPEGYERVFVEEGAPLAALLRLGLQQRTWRDDGLGPYAAHLLAALQREVSGGPATHATGSSLLVEALSARELEVLQLLGEGLTNEEVAQRLVVTLATVKSHTLSIYGKLGVHSRREAVAAATRLGLFP